MPYKILAFVAAVAALATLAPVPERYEFALHIVVSGVAAWGAVVAVGEGRPAWATALAVLAVVFNPFYVAPLGATVWAILGVAAAVVLAVSATRVGRLIESADQP